MGTCGDTGFRSFLIRKAVQPNLPFSPPDGRSTQKKAVMRVSCLVIRENHGRGPDSLQKKCLMAGELERPCFVTRGVKEAIWQVRLRAPSDSRLVLTALSRTSPRRVVRNTG